MTNRQLTDLQWAVLSAGEETEITGGYCGDLLSWVMGRAEAGQVWFTIMANLNAMAVASLVGFAAVVICNDAEVPDAVVEKAKEQGICLMTAATPIYEAATMFCRFIEK